MTCIVGVVDNGTIYMGGDSAAVASDIVILRKDPKVFENGGVLIGFSESFRMGQILQHIFTVPELPKVINDDTLYKYMCTSFIDALVDCFSKKRFLQEDSRRIRGGTFLVGVKGALFLIYSDFQIEMHHRPFNACGSGRKYALGALYALSNYRIDPETKVNIALDAASDCSLYVRRPYTIKVLPY